jgi:hypothetical protein
MPTRFLNSFNLEFGSSRSMTKLLPFISDGSNLNCLRNFSRSFRFFPLPDQSAATAAVLAAK